MNTLQRMGLSLVLSFPLAPALARIHARMKDAFDPAHIFNPGRLYPESA